MKINHLKRAGVLLLCTLVGACVLPHSETRSGTRRPSLAIVGAPTGAVLRLDGVLMGDAGQYDGHRQVLNVEEGLHTVMIESQGAVIYTTKVYAAGAETSRVEVAEGSH
jgi:hypothetical protein